MDFYGRFFLVDIVPVRGLEKIVFLLLEINSKQIILIEIRLSQIQSQRSRSSDVELSTAKTSFPNRMIDIRSDSAQSVECWWALLRSNVPKSSQFPRTSIKGA